MHEKMFLTCCHLDAVVMTTDQCIVIDAFVARRNFPNQRPDRIDDDVNDDDVIEICEMIKVEKLQVKVGRARL